MKLPEIEQVLNKLQIVHAKYGDETKAILDWVMDQRKLIECNRRLIKKGSELAKIEIFKTIIEAFLMRGVRGERGIKLRDSIKTHINSRRDLKNNKLLQQTISVGKYRWGEEIGVNILQNVRNTIEKEYDWVWSKYFNLVDEQHENNFNDDPFLKIKFIGYKVRDLALSGFNDKYIANDLHVVRVTTRIGLLNYGFHLLKNDQYEMGNNPSNQKNYLFLHQLFQFLSEKTKFKYSPVDIDRTFWHLGRSICSYKPKCEKCPINTICLTGRIRVSGN